jgi:8-oxo-dGTP pyrophosphatase MutT (NUDIX family)
MNAPMDAEFADDLTRLSGADLRALIHARVLDAPAAEARFDWRTGTSAMGLPRAVPKDFPETPVHAAVLVPLVERESGLAVLLTQRAGHLKNHPGQISFPGGRIETHDADAIAAALREAQEEIGLTRDFVEVVGFLPDHLIVSGYRVTPVVSFVRPGFRLQLDATEVEEAFEVPLAHLLDARNHVRRRRRFDGREVELTDLPFESRTIWGATAGMLLTLYRLLRGEVMA